MNVLSAYEVCPSCGGHGHYFDEMKGEPTWCRECRSTGAVRARDNRGRFLGRVDPIWNEYVGNVLAMEVTPEVLSDLDLLDMEEADKARVRQTY